MREKIKTILFDLDGTIVDTEKVAADSVWEFFAQWKIQLQTEDAGYLTGRTWASAFNYLFNKYSIPISKEEASRQMLEKYRHSIENNLAIIPGSTTAIANLAPHFSLGLVSGSHRADIEWALKKLGVYHHFHTILGAEDYPRSKPQPDGYLKALQLMDTRPEACLIFEDSEAGIQSARAAGTWVAAITHANHFGQNCREAHVQIPNFNLVTAEWVHHLSFDSH